MIILLGEMYLQQEVQYDGRELTGCTNLLQLYKSILCFMVVSLKQSTPYILKDIPLTKIDHHIVQNGILDCLKVLNEALFNTRAVISDNHPTNVSAFKHLKERYPCSLRENSMISPSNPDRHLYLLFDSVHLMKNIRNNLIAKGFFQIPGLSTSLMDSFFDVVPGFIKWSVFHRIHERDLEMQCHLRKAPKISEQVLHPGNNKQSVTHALAIFDLTIAAIHQYFPEEITSSSFLNLIYIWWLVLNARERFHPIIVGNALVSNDEKINFLQKMSNWLSQWRD